MQLENAKAVVRKLVSEGYKASVYQDYSGRGSYGFPTSAVVCNNPEAPERVMDELGIEDTCRLDSMGLDYIIY